MLRRYLLFTLPVTVFLWMLFALFYFGYCGWVDWVSILVAQPCYLLEEVTTRSVLNAFPALGIQESTLSHLVLILAFILWSSFLTVPFWFPSATERRRGRLSMLVCWPLAAFLLLGSLAYSIHNMIRHMH